MDKIPIRGIFALGPAPPGHRPPNTALFARLESHLLTMCRHLKDTTARMDRLRSAIRIERNAAMRQAIREEVLKTIKEQVRARELIAKYRVKLQTLQEAEILKVVKHMHEMGKNAQEVNNKLAFLRVTLKRETDPATFRYKEEKICALVKEQENAKDLRERWRIRLVQMESAKIKLVTPPAILQQECVSMKMPSPKPKTETEGVIKVAAGNMRKQILTPRTDTEGVKKVVTENIKKQIASPKKDSEGLNKVVAENKRKQLPTPKPVTDPKCSSKVETENKRMKISSLKAKTGTEGISKIVTENIKTQIASPKRDSEGINKVVAQNKRKQVRRINILQLESARILTPKPMIQIASPKRDSEGINKVVAGNKRKQILTPKPMTDPKCTSKVETENKRMKISSPKARTDTESISSPVSKNIINKQETADTLRISKVVSLKTNEMINKRRKDNKGCKRCAFLQRANKNKKCGPKICKVCLKWAHKVLQNGVDNNKDIKTPVDSETESADSESEMTQTIPSKQIVPDSNADIEATIKVEIEPVLEFGMPSEKVTLLDTTKSSINEEIQVIQPLDASMNDVIKAKEVMSDVIQEDEIMSDLIKDAEMMSNVIKEEEKDASTNAELMSDVIKEKEDCAKPESLDFERVTSIQDELKAIDDKNTALAHVRLLQEYAMLNDNYRVIGLLSAVEKAIIDPPKNEDFEYQL